MSLYTFNDNVQLNAPKHIDTRYINLFTPYTNVGAANAAIPAGYRYLGLTVLIGTAEYWYQAGTGDGNLVLKTSGITSADNGLTANTSSNIRLGGTLVANTTIDGSTSFELTVQGSTNTANGLFYVNNTLASGANTAVKGKSIDGTAILGISTNGSAISGISTSNTAVLGSSTSAEGGGFGSSSGTGVRGTSTSGVGGVFQVIPSSTNTTVTTAQFIRGSTGTVANNLGGSIDFRLYTVTTQDQLSNQLISKWTDATLATRTSQFSITGVNNGSTGTILTIGADGTLTTVGALVGKIITTGAGTYTILATDYAVIATGTTSTWTFPTAVTGRILLLVNHGSGAVTLGTAVTTANATTTTNLPAGSTYQIMYDGTVWRKIN